MKIGDSASLIKTFSEEDVIVFSRLSLDTNPIHLDQNFAEKSIFKKRIVHGLLVASLISAVIGTLLPGPGAIYLSQTINFKAPVFIGDTIRSEVTIKDIQKNKIILMETKCFKENQIIIDGEATILYHI